MAARYGVLGAVALTSVWLAATPAPAQVSAEIQAETQAIQAEVRAYEQGQALKRQQRLQERIEGIRSNVGAIDRCLAAAQAGDYVDTAFGVCHTTTRASYERWIVQEVLGGRQDPARVASELANAQKLSETSLRSLRAERSALIAEFNGKLASLTGLRNAGRGAGAPAPQGGPLAGACMLGAWQNRTQTGGFSVWTINADGSARESGLGNGSGTASATGLMLTIRWKTPNGYTGHYTIGFDPACQHGQGEAVQETAPPGIRPTSSPTTWTR